jgi:predicted dehydrogenase
MIGVGVVGCNYGRTVLVPAFRHDPRCEIVALAGTDAGRTAEVARAVNVARGFGDWQALVDEPTVAVVAVAVPPHLQPAIAQRALELGKAVFLEKPLAADLAGAQTILDWGRKSGRPIAVDFNFPELPSWRRAKAMLESGTIGRLHNAVVAWNFENQATRLRLESWKTRGNDGGGLLGNFVSHCFYNLEWLCGPISGLSARIFALPDGKTDAVATLSLSFAWVRPEAGELCSVSRLGSSHRALWGRRYADLVKSHPQLLSWLRTASGTPWRGCVETSAGRAGG